MRLPQCELLHWMNLPPYCHIFNDWKPISNGWTPISILQCRGVCFLARRARLPTTILQCRGCCFLARRARLTATILQCRGFCFLARRARLPTKLLQPSCQPSTRAISGGLDFLLGWSGGLATRGWRLQVDEFLVCTWLE